MAKTRPQETEQEQAGQDQPAAEPTNKPKDNGETVSAYFRRLFTENPRWLEGSSNKKVLQRWLDDHPGETEVPNRVKYILSNVKSVLRKKRRQKPGRPPRKEKAVEPTPESKIIHPRKGTATLLETLEEKIDECMSMARDLDQEGLAGVVANLRNARNQVVWKLGE